MNTLVYGIYFLLDDEVGDLAEYVVRGVYEELFPDPVMFRADMEVVSDESSSDSDALLYWVDAPVSGRREFLDELNAASHFFEFRLLRVED